MLEPVLVELDAAAYVSLQNLTLEATRGPLMQIFSGNNCSIVGCLLRNGGEYAAEITGTSNGLDQCEIVDCGEDGVLLGGGSRASLTAGGDFVTNTRIHRISRINWTYHPAINFFDGCGNVAKYNFIDQLPHSAVMLCGNNHVIEYNEISRVCQLTSDSGAIYSGRDWGYRGNIISYNFIHHLENSLEGPDTHGVYLDDLMSSAQVVGNVFYALGGAGIFSGGGRDNNMSNNIIAGCAMGHYDGDYARNQVNNTPGNSFNLLQRLSAEGISYQSGVWASAYPTCAAIPNSWTLVQQGLWRNPQGCAFSNNAGWSNTTWTYETDVSGTGVFAVYASFTNNNPNQTPLFSEAASWDRTLRPATLTASLAGFTPIAFSSIGPSSPSPATLAPPVQRVQSLGVNETEVDVQWVDDGNLRLQQPTGFTLQQQLGTTGTWTSIQSFGPDVNNAAVTGLSPDTTYSFRVQASNAAGTTASGALTVTTLVAPLVPGTPVRFEAESPLNVIVSLNKYAPVGILLPTWSAERRSASSTSGTPSASTSRSRPRAPIKSGLGSAPATPTFRSAPATGRTGMPSTWMARASPSSGTRQPSPRSANRSARPTGARCTVETSPSRRAPIHWTSSANGAGRPPTSCRWRRWLSRSRRALQRVRRTFSRPIGAEA